MYQTLTLKPELSFVFSISKMSNQPTLSKGEKGSSYSASCLVKLTRQASKEGDPSIHVYGGEPNARQL